MSSTQAEVSKQKDLEISADVIDFTISEALNSHKEYAPLDAILRANPSDELMVSDVDEQILLKIVFKEPTTILKMSLRASKGPSQVVQDTGIEASGPAFVKCFANEESLDFQEAEASTPAQSIIFEENDLTEEKTKLLRGSKFQRCSSIQLLIETNQNETPYTFLNRLTLLGHPKATIIYMV